MRSNFINGRYMVYEDSSIYDCKKGRYLKLCYSQQYITAFISGKNWYVHRLLAISFIPNPNDYPLINHIDGVCHNNKLDNLEWCTHAHNMQHSFDIGLRTEGNARRSKLISKKVYNSCTGETFDSAKEAAEYYNINHQTLIGKLSGHDNNNTYLNYIV